MILAFRRFWLLRRPAIWKKMEKKRAAVGLPQQGGLSKAVSRYKVVKSLGVTGELHS